ncbi:acetyltransferase [Vibrio metoecus]
MVTVVVFEFSGMRCQPLRRALAQFGKNGDSGTNGSCICKAWSA